MTPTLRSLAFLATSAAVGFGSTLLCAWPAVTEAQGQAAVLEQQAGIGAGTSKIGPLVATSRVVTGGGRCFVETRVRNPSEQRVDEAPLESDVYRTVSHPMARVGPMPTKVWQASHVVSVAPGSEIALRDELTSELCAQITARPKAAPNNNASAMGMAPMTSFHTAVLGAQPPQPADPTVQRQAQTRKAASSRPVSRSRRRAPSSAVAGPLAQQAQRQRRTGG